MIKPEKKVRLRKILDRVLVSIAFLAIASLFFTIGFNHEKGQLVYIHWFANLLSIIFLVQESIRWLIAVSPQENLKKRWPEILFVLLMTFQILFAGFFLSSFSEIFFFLSDRQSYLLYLGLLKIALILIIFLRSIKLNKLFSQIDLHPGTILTVSFFLLIAIGTVALLLPKSVPAGEEISFIDALFTSTSAVCVTGLIVLDTPNDFATFGKFVIFILIQAGGLGIMTLTSFFTAIFSGGLSFKVRIMMKDLLSQENLSDVRKLLVKITIMTIAFEAIGALLLYLSKSGSLSGFDLEWAIISVFHSVSAFCNAGFSLYTDSLMAAEVSTNYFFSSVIMILIVFGGLGFATLHEISLIRPFSVRKKRIRHQLGINSKIILISTAILLIIGWILFYLIGNFGSSIPEALFHSLFQSVTARTAGFNTVDIGAMAAPATLLMIFLMWIGASPGSTGGGIKTTTFAISNLALFYYVRGKTEIVIFGRRVRPESIQTALLVIISSVIALFAGVLILLIIEPELEPVDLVFEAVSAISTVGLSRGVTAELSPGGKLVIILLMFIGRISVLTFFLSFFKKTSPDRIKYPDQNLIIG